MIIFESIFTMFESSIFFGQLRLKSNNHNQISLVKIRETLARYAECVTDLD